MEVQASTKAGRGNWSNPVETRTYPERKIDPALFHGFTIVIIIIIIIIIVVGVVVITFILSEPCLEVDYEYVNRHIKYKINKIVSLSFSFTSFTVKIFFSMYCHVAEV